jgi:hypothetical protein
MKTLFGMTAAVLLVVTMLFVSLPGTGVAKEKKCVTDGIYVDRKNPKLRKLSICEDNNTKAVTYEMNCYGQYQCKNGKLVKLAEEICERTNSLPTTDDCLAHKKICINGECVCPLAGKMQQAMAGAQKVCGCTTCTECEECGDNEKCKLIKNASPSNPKCLKK